MYFLSRSHSMKLFAMRMDDDCYLFVTVSCVPLRLNSWCAFCHSFLLMALGVRCCYFLPQGMVWVCEGCCNKISQTGDLTKIYLLPVLEATSLKSRSRQSRALSGLERRICFIPFLVSGIAGGPRPWLVGASDNVCLCLHLVLPVCLSSSSYQSYWMESPLYGRMTSP